jgi:hypothetical protein
MIMTTRQAYPESLNTGISADLHAPTVTSVVPDNGAAAGGTAVTVHGTNFSKSAGPTVAFGGVPCTSVVVTSATTITCVTGAHGAGAVSAVVTNAAGGDGNSMVGTGLAAYTYT